MVTASGEPRSKGSFITMAEASGRHEFLVDRPATRPGKTVQNKSFFKRDESFVAAFVETWNGSQPEELGGWSSGKPAKVSPAGPTAFERHAGRLGLTEQDCAALAASAQLVRAQPRSMLRARMAPEKMGHAR